MKKIILFIVVFLGIYLSPKINAQPVISMDSVNSISFDRARFYATLSDKDGWIINGYGFIYDTISPPARQNGAKIKQVAPSSPVVNVPFNTTPTATTELLASGKTYYVRAYVKRSNPSSDTAYSNIISFVTPNAIPPSITTNIATDTGLFSATIHAEITQKNDPSILVKGFIYDTADNPVHGNGVLLNISGNIPSYPHTMSRNLTGLISGKTYFYRAFVIVKYTNKTLNDTIYANVQSFKTIHPCGNPPYDVGTDEITRTTAKIVWTKALGQVNFEIDYGFVGHTPGDGVIANSSFDTITITNLTPGMQYSVFVRAVCDELYSDWSVVKTFMTIPPLCAPISNLFITGIEHSSAIVSWIPGSMLQDKWEVLFALFTNDFPSSGTIINQYPNFYPIGLLPATRYKVKVRAVCENGYESDWSEDLLFNTKPASIEDIDSNNIDFDIFPNPSKDIVNFKSNDNNINLIEIWNSLGEIIYSNNKVPESYSFTNHGKGMYLIRIHSNNKIKTKKVIIQ